MTDRNNTYNHHTGGEEGGGDKHKEGPRYDQEETMLNLKHSEWNFFNSIHINFKRSNDDDDDHQRGASSQCHVLMLTQWPYYFVQRYMSLFFNQKPNDTISQAARGQSTRPGSLFFIP